MSRITPPAPASPSGSNPERKPPAPAGQAPVRPVNQTSAPGMPANKPNVTPPKAPSVGASAPPTRQGMPANKVPPNVGGNGAGKPGSPTMGGPVAPRTPGMPGIEQLQGRPTGRVLTKMGKVTREQVVEALD